MIEYDMMSFPYVLDDNKDFVPREAVKEPEGLETMNRTSLLVINGVDDLAVCYKLEGSGSSPLFFGPGNLTYALRRDPRLAACEHSSPGNDTSGLQKFGKANKSLQETAPLDRVFVDGLAACCYVISHTQIGELDIPQVWKLENICIQCCLKQIVQGFETFFTSNFQNNQYDGGERNQEVLVVSPSNSSLEDDFYTVPEIMEELDRLQRIVPAERLV